MLGYFSVMGVCQFLIMSLIFPYMVYDSEIWLKTTVCSLFIAWITLGVIVQSLGPGLVKKDKSMTLMKLLE